MAKSKKPNDLDLFPWEQQPGETAKKYEAFLNYLQQKTEDENRSLRKVAYDLNKSLTYIGTLSSENNWVERAAAWDREQLAIARRKCEAEILKMRERHAKIATSMLTKATKRLASMQAEELTPQDIKNWVDVASKLERISRGDVGEVVEERDGGAAINPVQIYIPDNGRDDNEDDE